MLNSLGVMTRTGKGSPARFIVGIALLATGWAVMWGVDSFWNPVAFTALWTGAALSMWAFSRSGYPGVRRHLYLAGVSVPVWWWFELINGRAQNWIYVYRFDYSSIEYGLLTSLAFATVVPAIVAAVSLVDGGGRTLHPYARGSGSQARLALILVASGAALQVAVVAFPVQMYPFIWVAPALVFDGLVVRAGGRSLARSLFTGRFGECAIIAVGGLICGFLWEFWNFWSMPKWEYSIPLVGVWKVFEMPVAGYLGYIPFAWSVVQFVRWLDLIRSRIAYDFLRRTRWPWTSRV